jgi:hypothetical protein
LTTLRLRQHGLSCYKQYKQDRDGLEELLHAP